MSKGMHVVVLLAASISLAGCATQAVIADLESDKVMVRASGGDQSVIDAEAMRGCQMHNKTPQAVSYQCLDGYCIEKLYLYACK